MPLKIRLKPNERLVVNGAVLRNNEGEVIELMVENRANLMRERDIVRPEQVEDTLSATYLALQMLYLQPDPDGAQRAAFMRMAAHAYAGATAEQVREDLMEVVNLVGQGDYYRALSVIRPHLPQSRPA